LHDRQRPRKAHKNRHQRKARSREHNETNSLYGISSQIATLYFLFLPGYFAMKQRFSQGVLPAAQTSPKIQTVLPIHDCILRLVVI